MRVVAWFGVYPNDGGTYNLYWALCISPENRRLLSVIHQLSVSLSSITIVRSKVLGIINLDSSKVRS